MENTPGSVVDNTPEVALDEPAHALPALAAAVLPLTWLATPAFCCKVACWSQFCIDDHDDEFTPVVLGSTELLAGLNNRPIWLCRYVPAIAHDPHEPDADTWAPPRAWSIDMPHGSGIDDNEV